MWKRYIKIVLDYNVNHAMQDIQNKYNKPVTLKRTYLFYKMYDANPDK